MKPKTKGNSRRRGFFITVDITIGMMVLFAAIALSFYYFSLPYKNASSSTLLRSYLQDASSVMQQKGYLGAPLNNKADTRGIREVLRSIPDSICMQVEAYNASMGLQYVVNKDQCQYAGGEMQSLAFPFSYVKNQDENGYYLAVMKAWPKGVR